MANLSHDELAMLFGGLVPPEGVSYEDWYKQYLFDIAHHPLPHSNADRLPERVKWAVYQLILADENQDVTYQEWSALLYQHGYLIKWPGCQKLVAAAWKWAGRTPEARKNSPVKGKRGIKTNG